MRLTDVLTFAGPRFALGSSLAGMWRLAFGVMLLSSTLAQPLEVGTVPSDQYTAAPAPALYGTEGWRTGRSTFFDGSDPFKEAYLARSVLLSLKAAQSKYMILVLPIAHTLHAHAAFAALANAKGATWSLQLHATACAQSFC